MNTSESIAIPTARRKRGRRSSDAVDGDIKTSRSRLSRAVPYIMDQVGSRGLTEQPIDGLVQLALDREMQIVRDKELVEIREIPVPEKISSFNGTPVTTRLAIHVNSVSKCLNHAFKQIAFHENGRVPPISFTPEAYILMSKACEQFILEITVRSFVTSVLSGSPHFLSSSSLALACRSAWRSKNDLASNGSFDFLIDTVDRFPGKARELLDFIASIHKQ